jgi:DNA-binding LacI/PurR family transcriptional regulator
VDYDWEHETERALRHVLRTGARHIWGYSGLTPEQKAQITHRAVAAECPGARPRPVVRWHPIDFRSAILSEHVRSAFDAATSELTVGRPIDGIVAGDDFITQGILDALTKQGRRIPEDLAFVGLINKTSRIHSPYLFTSLVADGQLAARETAALVDAHVRHRERAPRRVILSCELRMP